MSAKKLAQWLAFNAAVCAGIYYGPFEGVEWMANLVLFALPAYAIIAGVLWVIVLFALLGVDGDDVPPESSDAVEAIQSPGWFAPLNHTVGFAQVFALASAGWFFTATAWGLLQFAEVLVFHQVKNLSTPDSETGEQA